MIGPDLHWPRRSVLAACLNRFGGIVKFALVGDQLRVILGGGVLDYPTELVAHSIYRRIERRWRIWPRGAGGRRGEASSVRGKVAFTVAVAPVIAGHATGESRRCGGEVWTCGGHRDGTTAVSPFNHGGEQGEEYRGWPGWLPARRRRRSFYPEALSGYQRAWILTAAARIFAQGGHRRWGRRAGDLIYSRSLYHRRLIQYVWQSIFKATFLQIFHKNFINSL
jgi:hypothetical protein